MGSFRKGRRVRARDLTPSTPSHSECCGGLEYYDKAFDRITTRNEKSLRSIKRIFHTVTTTDDPVIRKVTRPQPPLTHTHTHTSPTHTHTHTSRNVHRQCLFIS